MTHRKDRKTPAAPTGGGREFWILGFILLVGLGLRGLYLAEIIDEPEFTQPAVDAEFHHYWARGLATGDWTPPHGQPDPGIRSTPFLRPPGYPYFLALIFKIAGPGFVAPRVVQFLLGLLNCWLGYVVARRWQGAGVGLLCAALMAVDWVFIYFESRFLEPALLITLLLSAVLFLGRWMQTGAVRHVLAAGVLLGLAGTVRPNALFLLIASAVWMIGWARRGAPTRGTVVGAISLAVGGAIPVAPVAVRNYVVADDCVLISANAGVNLYIGNNEHSDGLFSGGLEGIGDFGTCYDYPRLVRNVERQLGRPMKYSEVSRYFAGRAWDYVAGHPGAVAKLTARKALQFWGPYEISHNSVVAYDRAFSKVLAHLPFGFSLVAGSFLLGVLVFGVGAKGNQPEGHGGSHSVPVAAGGERYVEAAEMNRTEQNRLAGLILAFVLTYFVSFLPFFNASLYRVPIIPFLMMFAAYGLVHLWRCLRARDLRLMGVWGAVWIVAWVAFAVPYVPFEADLGEWHFNRGVALDRNGDSQRALAQLAEAKRLRPEDVQTRCGLANALLDAGRADDAIAEWRGTLQMDPGNAVVLHDLGSALLRHGRYDDAIAVYTEAVRQHSDYSAPYFNLANLLAARGAYDRAIPLFEAGLKIEPDAAQGHTGLGMALARVGKLDLAIQQCEEAVRIRPDFVEGHINLGVLLVEQGRMQEAIEQYLEAFRLAPGHPHVCHNLGVAYQDLGRYKEAASYYRQALDLNPNLALSHRNLGEVLLLLDRPAEALPQLRQACTLLPKDAASYRDYGKALVRLNRTEEGIKNLARAVSLDPADVPAHMALADAYESNGQRDAAIAQYHAVLDFDADHREAKERLEALVGQ